MSAFGLLRPPATILFGEGAASELGALAAVYGVRVLVVTDSWLAASAHGAVVIESLHAAGLHIDVLDSVVAELPLATVEAAVEDARALRPDCIVGFGGGSSLDMAKLVAAGLAHDGPLRELYGDDKLRGATLPIIAVPTTAGTGSEVTPVAVLGDPELDLKIGISSARLIPRAAVCDPLLTHGAPPRVTAYAGADALAHAIEAYTAIRYSNWEAGRGRMFVGKNALSDRFALHAIRKISGSLLAAMRDEPEARAAMSEAALCAGLAFATAGTALAHALQYPIGARTATPHGLGVGLLLPHVMRFNLPVRETELADVGEALGVAADGAAAADAVQNLVRAAGIPSTLAELGIDRDELDHMADLALRVERLVLNNPRPADKQDLIDIMTSAYGETAGEPAPAQTGSVAL